MSYILPFSLMPTSDSSITIRISPQITAAVERQAARDELSLSDVTRMLLKGYAKGDIFVKVG